MGVVVLPSLCAQRLAVLYQTVDWADLPADLLALVMANFMEVHCPNFAALDLTLTPVFNAREIVTRAPKERLLQIPRQRRGKSTQPWREFASARFGSAAMARHEQLARALNGHDFFYMLLQARKICNI